MDIQQLRQKDCFPEKPLLEEVLGQSYNLYEQLLNTVQVPPYNASIEWRYYNDGKAWLCKLQRKKTTLFWLSAWNGCFKMTFYFNERHRIGFENLEISDDTKVLLENCKPIGKLLPLVLKINHEENLREALIVAAFKMASISK